MPRLAAAAVVVLVSGSALAQSTLAIDFESYATGNLVGANNGFGGGDGRVSGANDARWWNPGNSASDAQIVDGVGHLGAPSRMLRVDRRANSVPGGLDGVIAGVASPRLLDAAGETGVGAAGIDRMQISYWFRTADGVERSGFRFGAEAWGTQPGAGADRMTWNRFVEQNGALNFYSVGMVNQAPDYFPAADTLIASNLNWGEWYRVTIDIDFNDTIAGAAGTPGPTDDNDVVTTRLYNASGALLGAGVDTTWETGFRYQLFYSSSLFATDSVAFQARAGFGSAFQNYFGEVAFVDDVTLTTIPTPGALALLGLGGLAAARRRR